MDLEAMEKRLGALEDLEAIKKLQRQYMQHHDALEFREILDLFTDDAEVEVRGSGVLKGRENFQSISPHPLGPRRWERPKPPLGAAPMLTVDRGSAKGRWTV